MVTWVSVQNTLFYVFSILMPAQDTYLENIIIIVIYVHLQGHIFWINSCRDINLKVGFYNVNTSMPNLFSYIDDIACAKDDDSLALPGLEKSVDFLNKNKLQKLFCWFHTRYGWTLLADFLSHRLRKHEELYKFPF